MLLLVIIFIGLCYFLPGVLLHLRLRERGITLPVCLGLGMSLLVVVNVGVASIVGYVFPLQLVINIIIVVALGVYARSHISDWVNWLRGQLPWPAVGWGAVAAIFIIPAFIIPVPFDTDAQGFGFLALTVRLGGSIDSLSPFWPDIHYLYSPGFFLLAAQLSDMLGGLGMHIVVLGLGHVLGAATVAGVYAVGREFGGERVGGWAAAFSVIGYALFSTVMDSAYTNVFGNFLTTAILVLLFRAMREPNRFNIALAVVALASLPISHPDSIIHLLMAYVPFYATVWLAHERPTRKQYLTLIIVVPALAVALCLPWVIRMLPLVGGIDVHERQSPSITFFRSLLTLNGWLPPLLAIAGLGIVVYRRRWFDLWLITWAVAIIEVSALGNLDALSLRTAADPMQIFYPFGVAWHATIIPVPILAAEAVCAIPALRRSRLPWQGAVWGSAAIILVGIAAALFATPIIQFTKGRVAIVGAFSSDADLDAMTWIKNNTPDESFVLNYPGIEGDWAPVVTERKTVQFREQLFYINAQAAWTLQEDLKTAYLNPASAEAEQRIRDAGIDYILVPQIIGRPDTFASAMRWRLPFVEPMQSSFADAAYLELVQDFSGAQIYRVNVQP
jgi:hypothetical protein